LLIFWKKKQLTALLHFLEKLPLELLWLLTRLKTGIQRKLKTGTHRNVPANKQLRRTNIPKVKEQRNQQGKQLELAILRLHILHHFQTDTTSTA